jgi:hypothetical protein
MFNPPGGFPDDLIGKLDSEILPAEAAEMLASAKAAVVRTGEAVRDRA